MKKGFLENMLDVILIITSYYLSQTICNNVIHTKNGWIFVLILLAFYITFELIKYVIKNKIIHKNGKEK